MITTTGDLITFALRASGINGIGQTPSAEDSNTGLEFLRDLMAQWQRKRWLIWSLADTALTSTGAVSYTVGPGGDFNLARPDRIDSAFARLLPANPLAVDYPLSLIEAREDYNAIGLKTLSTFPQAAFYESAWPTGVLHVWPVPPANQFELHIATKAPLPVYGALTDTLNLPPEYLEALIWSLCIRLQMAYGLPARPDHVQAAQQAINVIRMANVQIANLAVPTFGPGGSGLAAGSDAYFQSGQW